ncbi:nucleoside ABC transporter membrane protein [Roseiarcus fermentans]|uniref:Nucleoside ABC transporter membrane protein n=1 Tax=Roseiarcus fermentans TaxID=1473586 RepID=A0A366FDW2_9HYPH|nr:ABC transporter permease [Roseiarcus fermentans]RBP12848.1 nucleoside ABC transporter membrane protein [Roseiarcus fermentans]
MLQFLVTWLATTPSLAVPYALGAVGLILSERAGVLNLTAEGLMLIGAVSAAGAVLSFHAPPLLGMAVGMAAAAFVSLLFAALVITFRANQVIAGLVTVFFCQGLSSLLGAQFGWTSKAFSGLGPVPFGPLATIPVLGPIVFGQDLVAYLVVPILFVVSVVLGRTRAGLNLRAVGENPEAADAAGVSVPITRFLAVIAGSALIGLAGAYISVASVKIWIDDMTAGRGWIAVALVIFARWNPWRALFGAVLFGAIQAIIPKLAAAGVMLPQYLVLTTPYLATLAVMIWVSIARRHAPGDEPGALGRPYVREERV